MWVFKQPMKYAHYYTSGYSNQSQQWLLQAVHEVLTKEIYQLLEKEPLKKHLEMVAKFPHYSQKNIQLLAKQAPEATEVASVNQWKE